MNRDKIINEACDFLNTIDEKNFNKAEQTLELGVKHCVYGHLFVNPNSPFYKVGVTVHRKGDTNTSFNKLAKHSKYTILGEIVDETLANINNMAKEGSIKIDCISWLKKQI